MEAPGDETRRPGGATGGAAGRSPPLQLERRPGRRPGRRRERRPELCRSAVHLRPGLSVSGIAVLVQRVAGKRHRRRLSWLSLPVRRHGGGRRERRLRQRSSRPPYSSAHRSNARRTRRILRNETFTGSVKQTWDASFRLRAGYLVTPWTLAYLTGGLAVGEVSGAFAYNGRSVRRLCGCRRASRRVSSSLVRHQSRRNGRRRPGARAGSVPQGQGGISLYRLRQDTRRLFRSPRTACGGVPVASLRPRRTVELHAAFHKVTVGLGFDF